MKYLIVGLGNKGAEYDGTRHNIGFDVLNLLAEKKKAEFKQAQLGDVIKVKHKGRILVLLKPSTYVNRSGKAVRYWAQKEKVAMENILIVADDLNLDFGRMRLRGKGSDGGHNGLKDIIFTIGQEFARLRIGIGSTFQKGDQVNHVLGTWSASEMVTLPELLNISMEIVLSFSTIGLERTMSQFNN